MLLGHTAHGTFAGSQVKVRATESKGESESNFGMAPEMFTKFL